MNTVHIRGGNSFILQLHLNHYGYHFPAKYHGHISDCRVCSNLIQSCIYTRRFRWFQKLDRSAKQNWLEGQMFVKRQTAPQTIRHLVCTQLCKVAYHLRQHDTAGSTVGCTQLHLEWCRFCYYNTFFLKTLLVCCFSSSLYVWCAQNHELWCVANKRERGWYINSLPRGSSVYNAKNDCGYLIQRKCIILRILNRLGNFFVSFDLVVYFYYLLNILVYILKIPSICVYLQWTRLTQIRIHNEKI